MVCFSAVWYDQTSYPTSWQLDPTEGPNRERRRLQRCYLTIPNKYLLKDRRKSEGNSELIWQTFCHMFPLLFTFTSHTPMFVFFFSDTMKPPLSFLFEDKTHSSFSSTVKDKATSEPIRYKFLPRCVLPLWLFCLYLESENVLKENTNTIDILCVFLSCCLQLGKM